MTGSFSIRAKLGAAFGVMIALLAALGLASWQQVDGLVGNTSSLAHDAVPSARAIGELKNRTGKFRRNQFRQIVVEPGGERQQVLDELEADLVDVEAVVDSYRHGLVTDAADEQGLASFEEAWRAYIRITSSLDARISARDTRGAVLLLNEGEGSDAWDRVKAESAAWDEVVTQYARADLRDVEEGVAGSRTLIGGFIAAGIGIGVALALLLTRWLVSALRRAYELARHDPLTGLPNHRHFHERFAQELARARRSGEAVALVAIDLDHFKRINDTHGHPVGDEVLRATALALREAVRPSDVVARLGGEEFALLLPGAEADEALEITERARAAVAAAAPAGLTVLCSAGVSAFPDDAHDASTLLGYADGALYWAKNSGRDQTRRYDPTGMSSGSPAELRAEVLALLREPNRLQPHFQPIVALANGSVVGYEALARFDHPSGRSPLAWFALARRFGLGVQLEALAVARALAAPARPADAFLSLNVSPSTLVASELGAVLPDELTGLVFEITEHESLSDDDRIHAAIADLRARGARVAIDDAGAGYAGLQHILRVAPDFIKLDRSLIEGIHRDAAKAALIEALAGFATRTGAVLCAEGIEHPSELAALTRLDVAQGQGYLLGHPAARWQPHQHHGLGPVVSAAA